tara:strand:+ start:4961 stop:6346 length:1386 start_codon:yes stop_codon:yes gene_type:complete
MLTLALAGCQMTGNVSPKYDVAVSKNSGLVLFSVSHEKKKKDKSFFMDDAANMKFSVDFRSVDNNMDIPAAFSNDTLALVKTSAFDSVWGRVYVREFAAGRYELSGWSLQWSIGTDVRIIKPKKSPAPITFEVLPGSITYIGNMHGGLVLSKTPFGYDMSAGAFPQIRNEAERDITVILKDYPQLAGKVDFAPLRSGPWQFGGQNNLYQGWIHGIGPSSPWQADEPGPPLTEIQIMQACMRYEESLAVQRIGQGDIQTKEDATAFADKVCSALAQTCVDNPSSEKCRSVATPFDLASEQGSSSNAALLNAATKGETATVKSLLEGGSDINVRNTVDWTPLMLASAERHTDTVKVLLEAGADPNAVNVLGRTALMFAAINGQDIIVKLLLERGAKLDIVPSDHSGWTALMAAAARGHVNTVVLLLENGADQNIRSKDGRTAIELARDEGYTEVVKTFSAIGN